MKVTGEINTGAWAFDPLEDPPVKHTPEETRIERRRPQVVDLSTFVPADRMTVLPSRHEVVDPYANAPALEAAQMASHHTYTPESRARAMLVKTSAVTVALAVLTAAAMIVFADGFLFFWWLALASLEWVGVFCFLALLDFRETPAAHLRQKTELYGDLMRREQRARLKALYGYDED